MAIRRVEHLKTLGIWPGIIGSDPRGLYRLTADPFTADGVIL